MTERDRLTELIKQAETQEKLDFLTANLDEAIDMSGGTKISCSIEYLIDYLLANGVIVLPCKVGDTVYWLDDIVDDELCAKCENYYEGGMGDYPACEKTPYGFRFARCVEIVEIVANKDFILRKFNDFGKTVFLNREEAERELERRQNDY